MLDLSQRKVAICLSSGFFGFYAHCGFMQAANRLGIKPVAITGCSAGALLGALWATGLPEETIRSTVLASSVRDILDPPSIRELTIGPMGLASGRRMERMLDRALTVHSFEECSIPFAVTAFDLSDGELKVIDSGPLARGVRASASLPGLFCATEINGHLYWDGAVAEKAPMAPIISRDDVDTVIVSYLARPDGSGTPRSFMASIRRAIDALVYASDRRTVAEARRRGLEVIVVAPKVTRCGPLKMGEGPTIVEQAERETMRIFSEEDFGCQELS